MKLSRPLALEEGPCSAFWHEPMEALYEQALLIAAQRMATTAYATGDIRYAVCGRDGRDFERVARYIQRRRFRRLTERNRAVSVRHPEYKLLEEQKHDE